MTSQPVQTPEQRHDRRLRVKHIVGPNGYLCVSRSHFYALVAAGKIPRPIKVGRVSLWRESSLIAFLEEAEKANG